MVTDDVKLGRRAAVPDSCAEPTGTLTRAKADSVARDPTAGSWTSGWRRVAAGEPA
jgi:hypothetical protein